MREVGFAVIIESLVPDDPGSAFIEGLTTFIIPRVFGPGITGIAPPASTDDQE
jgi:hypothetical protein